MIDPLKQALKEVLVDLKLRAQVRGDVVNGVVELDLSDGILTRAIEIIQLTEPE